MLEANKEMQKPLEQLMSKLGLIVHHELSIILGTEEDEEYNGKPQILVAGDDCLIRTNNEKFYVFSFHDVDAEPIWTDEQGVLDFYAGQDQAHDFPRVNDESIHYLRGFVEVAKNLLPSIEYFLKNGEEMPLSSSQDEK